MSASAIIAIAIIAVVLLAAVLLVTNIRRHDTRRGEGVLSRETRARSSSPFATRGMSAVDCSQVSSISTPW